MANKIQIKRGVKADLPILDSGELGFCTDSKQPYIGDGSVNYELLTNSLYNTDSFLYATTSGTPEAKTSAEVLGILSGNADANFDMNSQKIVGLADPQNPNDAANKSYVDGYVATGVSAKAAVLDKDVADPSTLTPSTGDRYWVAVSGTGDWSGQDYNIAEYNGSNWEFIVTEEGDYAYVDDEDIYYFRTANGVEKLARGIGAHASSHTDGTDDIQLATDSQKGLMSATYAGKLDGIQAGAEVNPDVVSQAEAEAGTATTERIWTAERVNDAIQALAPEGVTDFVSLTDTPADFTDDALKILRVNSSEDSVEFIDFSSIYLEDTPTNNELTKAPTSNWAYTHENASTGVHGAGSETLLHTASNIDGGTFV